MQPVAATMSRIELPGRAERGVTLDAAIGILCDNAIPKGLVFLPMRERTTLVDAARDAGFTPHAEVTAASFPDGRETFNPGRPEASPDFDIVLTLTYPGASGGFGLVENEEVLRRLHPLGLAHLTLEPFTDTAGRDVSPVSTDPRTGKLTLNLPPGIKGRTPAARGALLALRYEISRANVTLCSCASNLIVAFDPHSYIMVGPSHHSGIIHADLRR